MKLLLTNDDGVNAKGIYALAKELEKYHEVIIVAPHTQKSACGHSITITKPIIVKEVKLEGLKSKSYSLEGTPADCVRVGINKLVEGKIDMVLSGINYGSNLGTDVIYSGTVSAAIEAAICKIPSMAVSMDINRGEYENYEISAKYASEILKISIENHVKNDMVLNVNVPALSKDEIKGIKVCSVGNRLYDNCYIEETDENGDTVIEITGEVRDEHIDKTDTFYAKEGYVTVTPLHYDLTNFKILNNVNQWF